MASTIGRNLHLCFSMIKRPHHHPSPDDLDRPIPTTVLVKNFNTLYDPTCDSSTEPDLAAAFASRRFFFGAPGRSNSIVDGPGSPRRVGDGGGSVAVPTYSPDPYNDFRKSMQDMVEARGAARGDWEYLHELLMCYLALNPESAHKFIIGAFSDLLVSLMPPLPGPESVQAPTGGGKD